MAGRLGIDLRRLRYFIRAVELGSLRLTAEEFAVAQPVVTRQIQILEHELGADLLIRERQRIRPSEVGSVLYAEGRDIVAKADALRTRVRSLAKPKGLGLSIGVLQSFLDDLVPLALAAWRRRHPQMTITIQGTTTAEIVSLIGSGEIEMGLVVPPLNDTTLGVRVLGQELFVGIVAPDDPLAGKERGGVIDLLKGAFVTMPPGLPIRSAVEDIATSAGVKLAPVAELQSLQAIKALVRGGFGRSVLPMSAVGRDLRQGNLALVGIPAEVGKVRTIVAAYRRDRPPSNELLDLVDIITDVGARSGIIKRRE